MRLALTVVSPGAQRTADVVLDADPATPVVRVAAELGRFMGSGLPAQGTLSPGTGGRHGAKALRFAGPRSRGSLAMVSADLDGPFAAPLYVANQRIPHQLTLLESPIKDGAVVSLGSPEGCQAPEPGGLVEIRVMSGPGGQVSRFTGCPQDKPILAAAKTPMSVSGTKPLHRLPCGFSWMAAATARSLLTRECRPPWAASRSLMPRSGSRAKSSPSATRSLGWLSMSRRTLLCTGQQTALVLTSTGRHGCCRQSVPPSSSLPVPPSEPERRPLPILVAAVPLVLGLAMAYFLHQGSICWQ